MKVKDNIESIDATLNDISSNLYKLTRLLDDRLNDIFTILDEILKK